MSNKSGIYKIECLMTGDCYIGSAVYLKARFSQHRRLLSLGKHCNTRLLGAWNKYGEDSFRFVVLLKCDRSNLIFFEQRAIDTLQPRYNIEPKAGNSLGRVTPQEVRVKISQALKGKPIHPNTLAAITGRIFSSEVRAKIASRHLGKPKPKHTAAQRAARAAWQTGRKHTPESIQKMRVVQKAIPRIYTPERLARMSAAGKSRKPCSEETRRKLSEAGKGQVFSAERRARISASLTGKRRPPIPPEQRKKISEALKGRKFSAESVAKRLETRRANEARKNQLELAS